MSFARLASFGLILFLLSSFQTAQAQSQAERIFPDATKGFFAIEDLKLLETQWKKTQIGQLMNDPIMDAFKKDFRAQMAKRMEDRFGFTLDEIQQLPSGEVSGGMIAIPGQTPGYVVTLDVTGRQKETQDYLDRLTKKLTAAGVRRSVETYKEQDIVIFSFPERSTAAVRAGQPNRLVIPATPNRQAFYLWKNNSLLIADQLHLIRLISDRMQDPSKGRSLADVEDFQQVMKRCLSDLPAGTKPLIRWYLEPLNYGESIRVLMRGPAVEKRRNKPSIFTVLKEQGFDAIRGIGGVVNIKTEDKEVIYRVFVHTKKPYRLAMRMLVFPDNTNFAPPGWMPSDLARCSMFFVDSMAIFDNFGSLFDALVMQGEQGVWNDILKGLEEDPHGPQINLREEVVALLGQRVLGMSKYHLPITPQSESMIVAVELKENKEEDMKKALRKLFGSDSEMQKTEHGPYILWHRVPAEDIILPDTNLVGVPDLVSTPGSGKASQQDEEEKDADPMFPEATFTVAKGCLFVGTNLDYLKVILDRLDKELPKIADESEYREVDSIFTNLGITNKPHFLQFFARTDETIRPTYELIRQGKMPQSQAILGKAINALLITEEDKENGGGLRQQAIDGSNLPEFETIRNYFGPSGLYGTTEENGYFFKGFLLEKKADGQIGPDRSAKQPGESIIETKTVTVETKKDGTEKIEVKETTVIEEKPVQ